jgi:predicted dehydrogenase
MSPVNVDKKLKVGVVGLGKMGLLHASLLNFFPNIELAALCDKSWLMRKFAKSTLKGPFVTDKLDDMSALDLDLIYVTTPIPSHYAIVKNIYVKNIADNLFVEKTLSSSSAQSEELCILAEKSRGHNMVGYMKRFSVTFKKAKEVLDQGLLGSLISFDAYAYSSDFTGVQRKAMSTARGGVLEDLGSHVIDLALWLFADLLPIANVSSSTDPKSDSVYFEVIGLNNFGGKFDISWIKEGYRMPEFGLKIRGTDGNLRVDDNAIEVALNGEKIVLLHRQDLNDHVPYLLGESEFYRETDCFINSVLSDFELQSNFRTAAKVDHLLDQLRCKNHE